MPEARRVLDLQSSPNVHRPAEGRSGAFARPSHVAAHLDRLRPRLSCRRDYLLAAANWRKTPTRHPSECECEQLIGIGLHANSLPTDALPVPASTTPNPPVAWVVASE